MAFSHFRSCSVRKICGSSSSEFSKLQISFANSQFSFQTPRTLCPSRWIVGTPFRDVVEYISTPSPLLCFSTAAACIYSSCSQLCHRTRLAKGTTRQLTELKEHGRASDRRSVPTLRHCP